MARRKQKAEQSWVQWLIGVVVVALVALAGGMGLLGDGGGVVDTGSAPPRQPVAVGGAWYEVFFTQPGTGSLWPEERVVATIDGAAERVWVASFDFDLPATTEALIRAAARGVDVRVVVDEDNAALPAILQLRQNGIEVNPDTRTAFMHNKFIVVDDDQTWIGSMNLTENDVQRHNNNFVRVELVEFNADYAHEFEELWRDEFGPSSPADTPFPFLSFESSEVDVFFSPEDEPRLALLDALNAAQREIRFMAFSFTDEAVAEALIAAQRRGVAVSGVVESLNAEGTGSQYPRLLNLNFAIRRDGNGGIMHHKVMIVDGQTVVTGSYNFSLSAANSNDETMVIFRDPAIAQAFLGEWQRVWDEAE